MKHRRILSMILAVVMMLSLIPAVAAAETQGTDVTVTITHVSLNPARDALGFKAKVEGTTDPITEIGFCFRVNGGAERVFTLAKAPEDGVFTARVKNILANKGGQAILEAYAFVRMGEQTVKSEIRSTSMKDTLQTIDAVWYTAGYTQSQKDAVKALCESHQAQLESWSLHNIFGINQAPTTFFGTIGDHETAPQFDLSADTGASTGSVTVSENGIAFGYARDFMAEDFYLEAKIHVNGIADTENWPKFGLFVQNGSVCHNFYVDMTTELTSGAVGAVTSLDGNYDWAEAKIVPAAMAFSGKGEAVTLSLLKQGRRIHLFVDGNYALSSVWNIPGNAVTGLFGFNTGMTITEYFTDVSQQTLEAKAALLPESEQKKGDLFGYALHHRTSDGVDLSADNGNAPSVRVTGNAPQYAYLNDVFTEHFIFETEFHVEAVLNNDNWPKFGLLVNGDSEMVKFFVDMTPAMTASHVGVVYQPTNGGDDWGGSKSCEVPGMVFTGSDTVKLKLVREGRAYYFFVNDTLVMYDMLGFREEKGAVGIFSFNTLLTATNYTAASGICAADAIAEATKFGMTCNHFTETDNVFTLHTNSDAQHLVDDLTMGGITLREDFYRFTGKLSLTDAQDWGQARILISSDAQNEYFIALEKLPSGNYQIFSMSKANQDIWDVWQLIAHENDYGPKNWIDVELVVIGNTIYLVMDGKIVYTSNRVPMTHSTVKFTGFNVGTTTVENLNVQIFADQAAAEGYLADLTRAKESKAMFYRNELATVGADPSVIYISEGPEAGYYYMYVTADSLGNAGFLAYRSADMANWECMGTALRTFESYDETTGFTTVSYLTGDYWAPEVIYDADTGLYYLFYSATRKDDVTRFYADIAVSANPAGPFVSYNQYLGKAPMVLDAQNKICAYAPMFDFANMDPNDPLYETNTNGYMKVIDMSPFVDPVTGNKYMYFCHDLASELGIKQSGIYVIGLNDDYTPDYSNVKSLISPDRSLNEGKVNEAPFMLYRSGKYYLMYSANAFYQTSYCVRVAVGDSPVGPFTKLPQAEGGWLLYADGQWTAGTGHCSVVSRNGQDYIVYHAHKEQTEETLIRGIAMDQLQWVANTNGILVPVVSGPSKNSMPLTTGAYKNIAAEATVTSDGLEHAEALNDGVILHHGDSFLHDAVFDGGSATVRLQFDQVKTIRAVAVYNGYENPFHNIASIRLHLVGGGSVVYTDLTPENQEIPGSSAILEVIPTGVTAIEIVMRAQDTQYAISEIAVMAEA